MLGEIAHIILVLLAMLGIVMIIFSIVAYFTPPSPSMVKHFEMMAKADAEHYDENDDFDYPIKPNKYPLYRYIEVSGRGAVSVPSDRVRRSKGFQKKCISYA